VQCHRHDWQIEHRDNDVTIASGQSFAVVPYHQGPLTGCQPALESETRPACPAIDTVYQALVLVIQRAQAAIRRRHPEVPETFTVAAPYVPGRVIAYFAPKRWAVAGQVIGEIGLAANYLDRGGAHAMECLLHESVHAACAALGVRDTSRGGRYHNGRFAECAQRFGLIVERHRVIGHTTTALMPEVLEAYAREIASLDRVLGILRRLQVVGALSNLPGGFIEVEKGPPAYVSAICRCGTTRGLPRRLRMSRGAWTLGDVRCSVCGFRFEEEGLDQSRQRLPDLEPPVEPTHRPAIAEH
jgi:hypothetical protein